jgi:hypothetical protein
LQVIETSQTLLQQSLSCWQASPTAPHAGGVATPHVPSLRQTSTPQQSRSVTQSPPEYAQVGAHALASWSQ